MRRDSAERAVAHCRISWAADRATVFGRLEGGSGESPLVEHRQKMNLSMSPAPAVIGNEKKGRVPGSFPQTPGPQEEVKVRGSTVLTYGIIERIPSPDKGYILVSTLQVNMK